MTEKLPWRGRVMAVQPRIRLLRSFDEVSHSYLGYVLLVDGAIASEEREFMVAIGKGVQAKHGFKAGDVVQGKCAAVEDPSKETAGFYKASGLKILEEGQITNDPPPWLGIPPELGIYRQRGHRRLDRKTYNTRCRACIWGCLMPVEMVIDQWNPSQVQYRQESFCYGPKSCPLYRSGPTRKVPGRKGMVYEEEDWVDEDATAHRGLDE